MAQITCIVKLFTSDKPCELTTVSIHFFGCYLCKDFPSGYTFSDFPPIF